MANEIDNKVVSIQFDNSQFEKNVSQTLDSLQKLRDSLNMEQTTKSLQNIEKQINKFDVSGINSAVEGVGKAFTAMGEVGFSVINRLTNEAINFGKTITSQLTQPIREGMQTYEQQIKATQVTMNALNVQGKSGQAYVEGYLKDLNKYSDETIYRFSDMTTSLSKFVSAGVGIDDTTTAIKGLGNVAALSGANTNEFSRAIYNISQSLGMGKLITRDWMSIENANMATKEFKETLIDTAKQMGYIDEQGKLTAKALTNINSTQLNAAKSLQINYKNFRDSLSVGWLRNDVLIGTLKRYADETDELGKKGKAAATEVKTFTQMIDTLGDALATKWANIYNNITGNFIEAKEFWTDVSNTLESLLVPPLEHIEELTSKWKELGGRFKFIESLKMQVEGLKAVFNAIKGAWEVVFPPEKDIDRLQSATSGFQSLSFTIARFLISIAMPAAKITLGIATAVKVLINIIKELVQVVAPVIRLAATIILSIMDILAHIGELIFGLGQMNDATSQSMSIFERFAAVIATVCNFISNAVVGVHNAITSFIDSIAGFFGHGKKMSDEADEMNKAADKSQNAADKFAGVKKVFAPFITFLKGVGGFFARIGITLWQLIGQIFTEIGNAFTELNQQIDDSKLQPLEKLFMILQTIFQGGIIASYLRSLREGGGILQRIGDAISNFGGIADEFGNAIKRLSKSLSKDLKSFARERNARALRSFATSVLILAGALFVVSAIPSNKILGAVGAIGALVGILGVAAALLSRINHRQLGLSKDKGFFGNINELVNTFRPNQLQQVATAMISMSVAVLILSAAMSGLAQISWENIGKGLVAIAGLMAELYVMTRILQNQKGFLGAAIGMAILAGAVNSLSKSVALFASMDTAQLIQGTAAVAGIILAFGGMVALMKGASVSVGMIIGAFTLLAFGMDILAKALTTIGQLSTDQLQNGLTALGLAILGFVGSVLVLDKYVSGGKMVVMAASLTILSVGLIGVAAAFAIFSHVSWDGVQNGITAIAAIFGMMTIIGAFMAQSKLMMATLPIFAASVDLIAPGIIILASAFAIFNTVDWEAVSKGILAIASLSLIMTVVSAFMSTAPLMMATMAVFAASIDLIAPGILMLASALAILCAVDTSNIQNIALALGLLVAAVGGAMTVLSYFMTIAPLMMATMPILAVSFTLASVGIVLLATACSLLTKVDANQLATVTIALGALFAIIISVMGIISFLMSVFPIMIGAMPVLAVSFTLLSVGIVNMAVALKLIADVPWDSIQNGITAFLAILGVITLVSALMSVLPIMIATMPVLAASMLILAPALVTMAGAFMMFNGINWESVTTGIEAIDNLMGSLTKYATIMGLVPTIMLGMLEIILLIRTMAGVFSVLQTMNLTTLGEGFLIMCKNISEGIGVLAEAGKKYRKGIDSAVEAIYAVAQAHLVDNSTAYYQAGQTLINYLIDGMVSKSADVTYAMDQTLVSALTYMNISVAYSKGEEVGQDFATGVSDQNGDMVDAATAIMNSFYTYVYESGAYEAGAAVGDAFIRGFRGPAGIDDPDVSLKTLDGMDTVDNAVEQGSKTAAKTATEGGAEVGNEWSEVFGDTTKTGTQNAMTNIGDTITDNTPWLSLMSGNSGFTVGDVFGQSMEDGAQSHLDDLESQIQGKYSEILNLNGMASMGQAEGSFARATGKSYYDHTGHSNTIKNKHLERYVADKKTGAYAHWVDNQMVGYVSAANLPDWAKNNKNSIGQYKNAITDTINNSAAGTEKSGSGSKKTATTAEAENWGWGNIPKNFKLGAKGLTASQMRKFGKTYEAIYGGTTPDTAKNTGKAIEYGKEIVKLERQNNKLSKQNTKEAKTQVEVNQQLISQYKTLQSQTKTTETTKTTATAKFWGYGDIPKDFKPSNNGLTMKQREQFGKSWELMHGSEYGDQAIYDETYANYGEQIIKLEKRKHTLEDKNTEAAKTELELIDEEINRIKSLQSDWKAILDETTYTWGDKEGGKPNKKGHWTNLKSFKESYNWYQDIGQYTDAIDKWNGQLEKFDKDSKTLKNSEIIKKSGKSIRKFAKRITPASDYTEDVNYKNAIKAADDAQDQVEALETKISSDKSRLKSDKSLTKNQKKKLKKRIKKNQRKVNTINTNNKDELGIIKQYEDLNDVTTSYSDYSKARSDKSTKEGLVKNLDEQITNNKAKIKSDELSEEEKQKIEAAIKEDKETRANLQEDINSDAKIIDDFNKQKTELNNATQNGNLVSSIWAGIYAKTDEYKDAKTQRDTEEKDATKRIKRIESLNTRISAAETKRKKAKSKSEREMYSKYIEELKSERDEEKQALETDTENIEELDKTIKNGPNKSFKEFMKNVKDSIKDITKFTSALSKTAGENIFSHFTYGGTKKDFESGKMAHNYAGYGSTQNVWYENLKKDRDYLLSLSSLSTETKEYIQKNWRDLGDEMHAMVYGSAEDLKQIDQNIQQMKKNDTESAWDTYTSNIKYTAEWSDKLYELAELGFNANALKEIIDMGYSEESMQIVDNLLRMLKSGNETIRQEALTLGSNSAKSVTQSISDRIVEAYTYAGATPEQQKALKELFGLTDKNEKAVEKDATALSSNTVAWLISKLDPDETASGSKLLIDGITTGLLDQDKLQTLVDAATYVGKLTTDTINGVLNGTIDSGNVTSLPETSLTKVKDTYLEKVLSKVPESQKKRRQKITDAFNAAEANGSLTGQVLNDIDTYLTSGQKITGDKIISLINGEYAAGAVTKFIKSISDTSFNKWNEMLKHGAINSKAFSDSILTVLNDVNPNVYAIAGKMILKGMRKGLVDDEEISKLTKAASETGYLTIQTIADILQIHSPSRVTFKMGEYLNLGLANGLDASSLVSQEAAQNSAYAVLTELGSVDASNIQPTIAPVVDQDSLLAATQQLNGLVTQSTAQLAAQAQYQLDHNKAIQNFNQQVEFDDSQLISEITSMHSDMMKLQEYVGQLKITMDTGAVVGAIAPQMDKTLGQRVNRRGR